MFNSVLENYSGNNPFSEFKKLGTGVSKSILAVISKCRLAKTEFLNQLNSVSSEISVAPSEQVSSHLGYGLVLDFIPKNYSYDQIYITSSSNVVGEQSLAGSAEVDPGANVLSETVRENMRKYNRLSEQYVECSVTLAKLETLYRNIDDKKVYSLSLNQLTALGL